jgi:hypothetical protein
LRSHFLTITQTLKQYRELWSPAPFKVVQLPWFEQYPQLKAKLDSISQANLEFWQKDISGFAEFIADDFSDAEALVALAKIQQNSASTQRNKSEKKQTDSRFFKAGIKQRKWQQIQDFSAAMPWNHLPLIEWCSGKGYLAQYYSLQHHKPVECIEFNQALCDSGKKHAEKFKLDAIFFHADVLRDDTSQYFQSDKIAVGLHACGQLHINLIKQCVKQQIPFLAVAPCCYHLTDNQQHIVLSQTAQRSDLTFSRDEMRLALEQPITGTARELEQTHNLNIKRLAFDEYLKFKTGDNSYTEMPPLSKAWASQSLASCAEHLAQLKNIALDANIDWQYWQQKGESRYFYSQRYSLLRYLFRRLIELWLVMDRALYLEEQGFTVNIAEFCLTQTSPRNLIITAELKSISHAKS